MTNMASCWPKKVSKLESAVADNNLLKVKQYLDQGVSKQLLLFLAVRNSNVDMVELAISRGADLNFRTSREKTDKSSHLGKSLKKLLPPIYAALNNCDVEMMKFLIKKGASVDVKNKKGESPLFYAVRTIESSREQLQSIQVLLENGAQLDECRPDDGLCALHLAMMEQDEGLANLLINHGCSISLKTSDERSPLYMAVSLNLLSTARLLIRKGADVEERPKRKESPLIIAIHNRNADMVKLLIQNGALFGKYKTISTSGKVPLVVAIEERRTEIVKILIAAGANTNVLDLTGLPVIHTAILKGYNELATILIQNGCSLSPLALYKSTPLHSAIIASAKKCNNIELIEYLLKKGVDPNHEDKSGETPLSYRPPHLQKIGAKLPKQYIDALFVIVKHLAIHEAKKSPINKKNAAAILENKTLHEYFASCQKELILMKKTDIGDRTTYFRILVGSDNDLYMSVDEPEVKAAFQSSNYKQLFPIYHPLLLDQYNRGLQVSNEIDQPSPKKPRLSK